MAKSAFQMICFCVMMVIPACLAQTSCSEFAQITFAGNTYCPFGPDVTVVTDTSDCDPPCTADSGICLNETCNCFLLSSGETCDNPDSCVRLGTPCDSENGICQPAPGGSSGCACNPGWVSSPDKSTCNDIDECTIEGFPPVCDEENGICTNTNGSYTCGCKDGFTLGTDNFTCIGGEVFIAELNVGAIYMATLTGSDTPLNATYTILPLQNVARPVAVHFDPVDRMVYWTDITRNSISRASLDGSNQEIVATSTPNPDGLSLERKHRQIYWTDAALATIEKANYDGTDRLTIFNNLNNPRGIIAEGTTGNLYWTDLGSRATIEKSTLSGGSRTVLVNSGIMWPNDLYLDLAASRLYWCDAFVDKIEYISVDGTGRTEVYTSTSSVLPFSIYIFNNIVYWTDWEVGLAAYDLGGSSFIGFEAQLQGNTTTLNLPLPGAIRINTMTEVLPAITPEVTLQLDTESKILAAGTSYNATCNATRGSPPQTISWFIGTTQITTGIVLSICDNADDPSLFDTISVLTFIPTTADHMGYLSCKTSSGASQNLLLRVLNFCFTKTNGLTQVP